MFRVLSPVGAGSFALCFVLVASGCHKELVPWWRFASNEKIADVVYRSYCEPDPSTCLSRTDYKVEVQRTLKYLSVGFTHIENNQLIGMTCGNYQAMISCAGTGRFAYGLNPVKNYELILETKVNAGSN
jgi:hypothetical protein